MAHEIFLASVKKMTEQNLTISELIENVEKLRSAGEKEAVFQLYQLWIKLNQENPFLYAAYFNYAVILSETGDLSGSRDCLQRALELNPDLYPAYINLGSTLERLGDIQGAVTQWRALVDKLAIVTGTAIDFKTMALKQIGRVLESNGKSAAAQDILLQSLKINQNQIDVMHHYVATRLLQCQWPILMPWEGMSRKAMMKGISPLSMSVYTDDPMLQLATAWNYNKTFLGYPSVDFEEERRMSGASARAGRRRIGYVSSDIRDHAVGYALPEVFELHNRNEFEIFLYYSGPPSSDPIQARTKAAVEHWVDIAGLGERAIARRIVMDGIDILVDVNGHTKDAYTRVMGMRPAPIIANWFGYPGTMGSPYHHYIIADDWIIPKDHEMYYSEKVVRLPCYQPNDRKRNVSSRKPSRSDVGLPEDAMVYCCFNSTHKITRFTFERWMTILSRVPNSMFWLLDCDAEVKPRLAAVAAQYGVAEERLIYAAKINNADHLARYPLADLFLDTSPYGAHVTASDALWMGVPILTLSGRGFASRVCGSLTRAAGLPEMVCLTAEDYIEKAVALGMDLNKTQPLKKRLAEGRDTCTLFAMETLVHNLEKAYLSMWDEFRKGRRPQPDMSNMDVYLDIGCEENPDAVEMLTVPDYQERYKAKLAQTHRYSPIHEDNRLWTAADIACLEDETGAEIKKAG